MMVTNVQVATVPSTRVHVTAMLVFCCLGSLCSLLVGHFAAIADAHGPSGQLQDFEAYGFISSERNDSKSVIKDHFRDESSLNVSRENRTRHAILVPYRDRQFHLHVFRRHMSEYLQKFLPGADFDIWIVEQDDNELFNKGWLFNVAFEEAIKHSPNMKCIILHDVDLIPDMGTRRAVPYDTCGWPIRLANELEHFDWGAPYVDSAGGVVGISRSHYNQINGMSNLYFGWGGEDDDLKHRLRQNQLLKRERRWDNEIQKGLIMVPPRLQGTFHVINESQDHHPDNRKLRSREVEKFVWKRVMAMENDEELWRADGLSTLGYLPSQTNLTVHLESPNEFPGFASYHHIFVRWDSAKNNETMKTKREFSSPPLKVMGGRRS